MKKNKDSTQLIQAETAIAYVLRYGVLICAALIFLGMLLSWIWPLSSASLSPEAMKALLAGRENTSFVPPRTAMELIDRILVGNPGAVISLGLGLLIALPIIRVALTVFLFLLEKDRLYFILASIVLTVLLAGVFLGRAL